MQSQSRLGVAGTLAVVILGLALSTNAALSKESKKVKAVPQGQTDGMPDWAGPALGL